MARVTLTNDGKVGIQCARRFTTFACGTTYIKLNYSKSRSTKNVLKVMHSSHRRIAAAQ